jgi:hypothetical protein
MPLDPQSLSVIEKEQKNAVSALDELNGDPEGDHAIADQVLIDYLESTGQSDVSNAFQRARDRVGFWYA